MSQKPENYEAAYMFFVECIQDALTRTDAETESDTILTIMRHRMILDEWYAPHREGE